MIITFLDGLQLSII